MKKTFSAFALTLLSMSFASVAFAAGQRTNYVIFNVKGDCSQEDCIAATKDALKVFSDSVTAVDAVSLAPHQTVDYKTLVISFKDYKTAPYAPIKEKIASLGYEVVSYVIHDTHTGKDVIIPH